MRKNEKRWWIKINLKSINDISELQKVYNIEIFPSTLRRIDNKNLIIDGFIQKQLFDKLKLKYRVRILGDVEKMVKNASNYVSKKNRYKNH